MSRHHVRLHRARWQAARKHVFARDNYRCTMCGKAGRLECHHVTPLEREPGQDPFNVNGLATICRNCHIELTARQNRRQLSDAELSWQRMVRELI